MSVAALFLILVVAAVAIVGLLVVASRPQQLTRDQKRELRESRELIKKIEALAIRNSDVNPELAYQVRDEINQYELKELN